MYQSERVRRECLRRGIQDAGLRFVLGWAACVHINLSSKGLCKSSWVWGQT